ncbi:MAG: M48 family metallopeptidase [Ardenticatenia bacterium]|nr:M48 family metallopeptidase [Ardenticatenia bacterium]
MSIPSSREQHELDPRRQAQAREYAARRRMLMLVDLLLSGALMLAFLLSGWAVELKAWLLAAGVRHPWALVAAYVAIAYAGYALLTLPLAWWRGFVLPHRYGLSAQSIRAWLVDELKAFGLGMIIGVPVAEVVFWLLRTAPETWWVWAALFLSAVMVLLGHVAPVLIVPLFYTLTPLRDQELCDRIRRLAARAGVQVADVYTIHLSRRTRAANALVMGLGRTKRIALGDTLYADFSADEIEAILAHELGHQVHRDLELGVVVQSILAFGGMYVAHRFLWWGVDAFGLEGPGDVSALPLLTLAFGLFSVVVLPLANAYSRWRERLADRYALEVSDPAAFASAMIRLANQNLAEAEPPRWAVWLLATHPPVRERVALARAYKERAT